MSWTHRLPLPLDYLNSKPEGFQLPAESLDILFGAAQNKLSQSLQLMHPSASIHVLNMFRHLSKNAAANLLRENLTPVEVRARVVLVATVARSYHIEWLACTTWHVDSSVVGVRSFRAYSSFEGVRLYRGERR